jgi:hypothetical protein
MTLVKSLQVCNKNLKVQCMAGTKDGKYPQGGPFKLKGLVWDNNMKGA